MIELSGEHVRLIPLTRRHIGDLLAAATQDRTHFGYTWVPRDRDSMTAYVDDALTEAAGRRALPFAVFDRARHSIVGSTRFFDFAYWSGRDVPDGVEIGHTWYAASAQRTACNTESKLLLLSYAFETWKTTRVTLKTDARNHRSRAAIERIGGVFEGIRRAHQLAADGTVRDTAYFSILAAEWPKAREFLRMRLTAYAGTDSRSVERTSP